MQGFLVLVGGGKVPVIFHLHASELQNADARVSKGKLGNVKI